MTTKESLEKSGWVRISYRKMGMVIIAWWHDPKTGERHRQGDAVRIQTERNKIRRASAQNR